MPPRAVAKQLDRPLPDCAAKIGARQDLHDLVLFQALDELEACFSISYKLYHGELEKEVYYDVFDALRNMIKKRFQERKETHKEMWRWEALKQNTYQQILNKQASLFVIYDGTKQERNTMYEHIRHGSTGIQKSTGKTL